MNIGKTIRDLRKNEGYSQAEFSALCGISQTSLSQIETGTKRPSKKNLVKICEILEVPENLLYVLAMEEIDIPTTKKETFKVIFPSIKNILLNMLSKDSPEIKQAFVKKAEN